jgi:hypothetical protein
MSARRAIEDLLWWSVPGSDNAESKARAARMLDHYRDEVAHELAEKIRQEAAQRRAAGVWFDSDGEAEWRDVAALIDPEVSDG